MNLKTALKLATALGAIHAIPAFAQTAPADGLTGDIIVTARRTEERLQDVPISITVFNQQQLTNRNVVNSSDLAIYTPSLSANSNFGTENTSFAIRGFVQDPGTQPSVGVYFADVVAPRGPTQGTQAGDGAGPGSFFDLQNVQVLKGPQGTLQGRNTTGGAILFVPQKPTGNFEGYVEGSYGNYNMKRVQRAINIPLSDVARLRIAADHQERNGYLKNNSGVGARDFNDVGYTAIRASLVVDLTPDLENYTIVSYSRSNTNGSVQKLIGCNPAGQNPTSPAQFGAGVQNFIGLLSCGQIARENGRGAGFYDVQAALPGAHSLVEQWQVINTTTLHASDSLTIKNIASYAQYRNNQASPLFGANWQTSDLPAAYRPLYFRGVPASFAVIAPIPGRDTSSQYTLTEELQFQGNAMDTRLTYQGGAYLESSRPLRLSGAQSSQLAACTDLTNIVCSDPIGSTLTALTSAQLGFPVPIHVGSVNYTAGRTAFRNVGLYAQASYALSDQFKLTGGFRYTSDRQSNQSTRYFYNFDVFPPYTAPPVRACTDPGQAPTCNESLKQKSQKPTWLIDLDYKPMDDILIYAKYARGYRAGGVFANGPIDHRTFQPEKVDSYEGGFKTSFRGAVRGTFNVSAFYNNFSNQQIQAGFDSFVDPVTGARAPVPPTTGIVNAGKSRIYGVEVETTITPFTGLTFDASYTYLNATIRNIAPIGTIDPNYQAQAPAITPGSPLLLSPKNKFSVTGAYTLPLDESIGRITFAATYTHVDKQFSTYAYTNPATLAAFGSNLGLIGSRDLLNLNLSWNSIGGTGIDAALFATNVTKQRYYNYVPGLASSGAEFAVLGEPRMYGGRLRFHF